MQSIHCEYYVIPQHHPQLCFLFFLFFSLSTTARLWHFSSPPPLQGSIAAFFLLSLVPDTLLSSSQLTTQYGVWHARSGPYSDCLWWQSH